ncbi:MAG TPA: TetR/AcrR family transcriptional regulator [candidate division Zixibacteria bacterium]|nr:TetR/AcrR family transcriptional regulator [candidate division Zixibacteria bacterium]
MAEAKQDKRRIIIEAAEKLFAKSGFHGTDVDQVARTAGVSKGSVYNYFDSKEEILISVIEEGVDELDKKMRRYISPLDDPIEKLKKGIEFYVRFLEKREPLFKVLTGDRISLRMDLRKRFHLKIFARTEHAQKMIAEAIKDGRLKKVDPYIAATCLIGMIDSLFFRVVHEGRKMSAKHKAEQITKLFLEGMLL